MLIVCAPNEAARLQLTQSRGGPQYGGQAAGTNVPEPPSSESHVPPLKHVWLRSFLVLNLLSCQKCRLVDSRVVIASFPHS